MVVVITYPLIASSIPAVCVVTMDWWMSVLKNIIAFIMAGRSLQKAISIVNGIETFWSFSKARLMKLKGVPKHSFYYHLKETEFRFSHRHNDLYNILLKLLRIDQI